MEPLSMLVASTLISVLIAALVLWLGCSWIGTRLKAELEHEYDQKLVAQRAHWEARDEAERVRLLGPERERVTEVVVELCARWVGIADCITECGITKLGSVERSRFAYRDTFRKEMSYFDDYFRPRRAFLDEATAAEITATVARMRAEERELSGTLRDEENVDAAGAKREITKTFEVMSEQAVGIAELLEARCRAALTT
ncbi:MAG: hypothetical protein ACI8QZ_000212 [Chlamydiales bacterium]|jgi:hypothetical protein